ncbi:MAG: iron-regulated protein [Cyanobacteria bacterium QS_8_64_29]|nr:MAG: iron-regulated protein [Cyanobacteria bacterium QS_8_64_29]
MYHYQPFDLVCALVAVVLAGLCWGAPPALGDEHSPKRERQLSRMETVQALAQADVVYLGETHAQPQDHRDELAIIQALARQRDRLTIAMEMFQQPFQDALDRYLAGDISDTELRERSEYEQRWGFPWQYYAPILRFARSRALPAIALNAPTEAARQVARQGLASLSSAEWRCLPPPSQMQLGPPEYRRAIRQVYRDPPRSRQRQGFERFWATQILWDETMAQRIARLHRQNRDRAIVVLAGKGHVACGYGIPQRVARRVEGLRQRTVLLGGASAVPFEQCDPVADFVW